VNRYQRRHLRARGQGRLDLATAQLPTLEREWYPQIIDAATTAGWWVYHTADSRGSRRGFPDFVLLRERCVVVEAKSDDTDHPLTEAQRDVLERFARAGVEAYALSFPSDWDEFLAVITRRRRSR
jgi:hypothetical protein